MNDKIDGTLFWSMGYDYNTCHVTTVRTPEWIMRVSCISADATAITSCTKVFIPTGKGRDNLTCRTLEHLEFMTQKQRGWFVIWEHCLVLYNRVNFRGDKLILSCMRLLYWE